MASNQKLDRLLQEGRAFRFLVERQRVTATELGRHVLRDTAAPLERAEPIGREFGSRLVHAGKAVTRRGAFELRSR